MDRPGTRDHWRTVEQQSIRNADALFSFDASARAAAIAPGALRRSDMILVQSWSRSTQVISSRVTQIYSQFKLRTWTTRTIWTWSTGRHYRSKFDGSYRDAFQGPSTVKSVLLYRLSVWKRLRNFRRVGYSFSEHMWFGKEGCSFDACYIRYMLYWRLLRLG